MRKDLRIHGQDIGLTQGAIVALLALAAHLKPSDASTTAALVVNFNMVLTLFWGEWLISREKTKGTFAWLRASPITDRELVASKFAATAACCASLWLMTSTAFTEYSFVRRPLLWWDLLLALLVFGAVSTAARWRWGPKLGQMLPPALALALGGAVVWLEGMLGERLQIDVRHLLRSRAGLIALGVGLTACYAGVFLWTLAWVRRSDTAGLVE
ncbi:MAG: hypothetical protein M3Q55_10825 [Acidobacteriota bacterium]|nr:hypothetical protein [Acidobacteriota bacterium]